VTKIRPINIRWRYASNGISEDLITSEWAKLSLLEPEPRISYGPPGIQVLAPETMPVAGIFEVSGRQKNGNLPVFVRTFFKERRQIRQVTTGDAGSPSFLSKWPIVAVNFLVVDGERSYEQGLDFTVDKLGRLLPRGRRSPTSRSACSSPSCIRRTSARRIRTTGINPKAVGICGDSRQICYANCYTY
jgi:hypothetical protein